MNRVEELVTLCNKMQQVIDQQKKLAKTRETYIQLMETALHVRAQIVASQEYMINMLQEEILRRNDQ